MLSIVLGACLGIAADRLYPAAVSALIEFVKTSWQKLASSTKKGDDPGSPPPAP